MIHYLRCFYGSKEISVNARFMILLYVALLMSIPIDGFSQNSDQIEERIREIRSLYNEIVNKTETFEKKIFSNSQVAYLNKNQIVRIKTDNGEGKIFDFYYDINEDLFFAFSQDANGLENRYYFSTEENGLLNLRIPNLIKWLDSEKKQVNQSNLRFRDKRLEVIHESMLMKEEVNQSLLFDKFPLREKKERCRILENEAKRIDSSNKYLIESIDLLEGNDDSEFCTKKISKFGIEGESNVVYQIYYESCDPGCMVITELKKSEYYSDNGERFLMIIDKSTKAYSEENILFDMNNVKVIEREYFFYNQELEIYNKSSLIINDYLIY